MTVKISGIIYAKNEEALIEQAVRSLFRLADEVLVADMASTDRTAAIASELGATVVPVPDFGYVEPARPIAEAACRFEWIVNLDADEVLPAPLTRRLAEVAERDDIDAVRVSRLNFMIGSPVRRAGWGPAKDRHIRFHRKGSLSYSSDIHEPPTLSDGIRIEELPVSDELSVWHFNYTGWDHFLEKLNRYTTVEARQRARDGVPARSPYRAARVYARIFLKRFVKEQGFRDGYRGFALTMLMVMYQFAIETKVRQLTDVGDSTKIARHYREVAAELEAAFDTKYDTSDLPAM